jgi:predicted peptidase
MKQFAPRMLILFSFLCANCCLFAEVPNGIGPVKVPKELEKIPGGYFERSDQPGTLVDLTYRTYESFSYTKKNIPLQKHAVVYLPYGYREDQQYDVFYLMHGGWGDETSTLGTPRRPSAFKNVVDHAMAMGEIRQLIIVCPTYNNTNENGRDSDSFSLAMRLTENYHNELVNDLIPAVDAKYRTLASRDHRGFGGFSMGAVTTWRTFQYCLDSFRFFLPMSCGTSMDDDQIFAAASQHHPEDYFVFVMTGTNDFAFSFEESRIRRMGANRYFFDSDRIAHGNFAYRTKTGYSHDGTAAMEYTYNGMKAFWGKGTQPRLSQ